jgi:protein gp37
MQPTINDILVHYPELTGIHPACLAVPAISEEDCSALNEDIEKNGLIEDLLVTEDGLLVDGRNRLMACYLGHVEVRFKVTKTDPWIVSLSKNIARRHLTVGQKAMFGVEWKQHEAELAKKRQAHGQTSPGNNAYGNISTSVAGTARDIAGEKIGVSGKSVDKAEKITEVAPDIAEQVKQGDISLEEGYKEARNREKQSKALPVEQPSKVDSKAFATIITAKGVESQIPLPKSVVFNQTTDAVDWAAYTWNPVTGCEHGCNFCYAREIAHSQRMADYYPNKFEPTFHRYRLEAPSNMPKPKPDSGKDGRVFVCSMADLFGKWVPDEWIRSVFDACQDAPEWEYLFLTKWPARYSKMPLLEKAWYGASVIRQSDVSRVEKAMKSFSPNGVKWISLEPMLEPIKFEDISWCDLVVIGSQTSTNQPDGHVPEFAPEFDWIVDVVNQCRAEGVPYYLKANLGMDRPGMKLPKPGPRR